MKRLREIWATLLDILFPALCLSCRRFLSQEDKDETALVCRLCLASIEVNKIFFRIRDDFLLFAAGSYENDALRNLILAFKYRNLITLQKPLGEIAIRYLKDVYLPTGDTIVVPIPLHPSRLRSRGFNQAEVLAKTIAGHLNLPLETEVLKRIKNTKSQTGLSNHDERRQNIRNCFAVQSKAKELVKSQSILLVDDVYTSGATIEEAAKTLRRAGAKNIKVFVMAKAG